MSKPELSIPSGAPSADELLDAFVAYTEAQGFSMYPAQEEAILELLSGSNVILNTPTGSGKSLVALAACFKCLSDGGRAFYTAPIKALVTEKFFELCAVFGAEKVGMMTGDASVNTDAPVICCTAEILANKAIREGEATQADWVVMDEFHYYSDRDRGVSWQIPLLTLPKARFLLMSATLGGPEFFVTKLSELTSAKTALVQSSDRPVPLDWTYSEEPLQSTIDALLRENKAPIYIVHFSQRAASEQAQNLMSLNFTSKEGKEALKEALRGFRFDSAFGKELARFLPHGIGVHHAGMLPKYRRLVERLAKTGLLTIICGTDTLGVGVNIPIRTVLFTQLCKFDGRNTILLSTRDLHQIAGRAGRRGFDTAGSIVVQAPEHEIENLQQKRKAEASSKKKKKLHLKKAPERGYKAWNENILTKIRSAEATPLRSRMTVNHGILLGLLSGSGGWRAGVAMLRKSHESKAKKRALLREGMQFFRSLLLAGIVRIEAGSVVVDEDLQRDFSLNQALSLYAVEAFAALDPNARDYALVLLSITEAILENPWAILRQQVWVLKTRRMAEMKAEGIEYDERIELLEKVDYLKPEEEFIEATLSTFATHHPWVDKRAVAPKSIVRGMYEECISFNSYVKEYGLARSEGVLLRYLSSCYRCLRQTVPDAHKSEEVRDIEDWLGAEIRRVDASLLDEWEKMQQSVDGDAPTEVEKSPEEGEYDITRDKRAFRALVRRAAFGLVQDLAAKRHSRFLERLDAVALGEASDKDGTRWTLSIVYDAMVPYWEEHEEILLDGNARSNGRSLFDEESSTHWDLRQTISDPAGHNDWALQLRVDLDASKDANQPVLQLLCIASES